MKKRLIMVQNLDGTRDYLCAKCNTATKHTDSMSMSMCGGDVVERGGEYAVCPACGTPYDYPRLTVRDFSRAEVRF